MTQHTIILAAIRNGAHRTREIAEHSGLPRETVQSRIAELVRERIVSSFGTLPQYQKRGRPEKFYRIRG